MPLHEWGDTSQTIGALSDALATYDWPTARTICCQLIVDIDTAVTPYPEKAAKQILNMLRRKRCFELMELVADAILRAGQSSTQIWRQYAQSLIDQGKYSAARAVLEVIIADPEAPAGEKAEARGLRGRIFKQLYVNSRDPRNPRQQENLRQAVREYYGVFQAEPGAFLWHGINTVACLARGRRDGLDMQEFPEPEALAKQLDAVLQPMDELEYWNRATAIENAVAQADWASACEHAVYYTDDPKVDAFEIGSLLRQLTEVWELTEDKEPGNVLLPALKSALLRREGGSVQIRPAAIAAEKSNATAVKGNVAENVSGKKLEKVFGADRFQPLGWYKTGMQRCEAVARIESVVGTRLGTGFLVRAADFFPDRNEKELLLLTNAHVISPSDNPYPGALPPEAAMAIFEASGQTFEVGEVVWSSSPDELDATFVTLNALSEGGEMCPLKPPPATFDRTKAQRVYVIGYPEGGGLSFSLQDSAWLDTDGRVLHYRTPTNPGSSGSPVFDAEFWSLIALHHAGAKEMPRLNGGEGSYEANEGIAISAIREAIRETPPLSGAVTTNQAGER